MPNAVLAEWKGALEVYPVTVTNNTGASLTDVAIPIEIPSDDAFFTYLSQNNSSPTEWVVYDPDSQQILPTWFSGNPSAPIAYSKHVYWTKASIQSSKTFYLIRLGSSASQYYQPGQIFDKYAVGDTAELDSINLGTGASITSVTTYFLSPPNAYEFKGGSTTSERVYATARLNITVPKYAIFTSYFFVPVAAAGHPLAGIGSTSWAGPYIWIGGSYGPWRSTGTNIGYYTNNYYTLTQYVLNKWNKLWLVVDVENGNYDFYFNDSFSRTGIGFISGYDTWTPGGAGQLRVDATAQTVYFDDILYASYPVKPSFSTTTSGEVKTVGGVAELGVEKPYDIK